MLSTVDAASPDHLEPPPHASRGASTSATRHRAAPLVSPSLSPPAARAQSRPSPPMRVRSRGSTRSSPRSLSPFLAPYSTPTNVVDNPSLSPLAARAVATAPVLRVHGEPRDGYLRPPLSPLSTPLAPSPSRAPLDKHTPLPVSSIHRNGRSAAVGPSYHHLAVATPSVNPTPCRRVQELRRRPLHRAS